MSQRRLHSFYEVLLGTLIGFWVAFFSNLIILPAMGIQVTTHENLILVIAFTFVSICRSYLVRRFFNWLHVTGRL